LSFVVLQTIKRNKGDWIGHSRRRNCLLQHDIEGEIEATRRRERRRKQLLNDRKEKRGCWKLKEDALYRTMWRTRFGRACGQTTVYTDGGRPRRNMQLANKTQLCCTDLHKGHPATGRGGPKGSG